MDAELVAEGQSFLDLSAAGLELTGYRRAAIASSRSAGLEPLVAIRSTSRPSALRHCQYLSMLELY